MRFSAKDEAMQRTTNNGITIKEIRVFTNERRFKKNGVEIVQAEGDDLRFLLARGAEASYWDGRITHVGEIPSASAMF